MTFGDMKITPEESEALDWCYSSLDPRKAAEIEQQAFELATEEVFDVEAAATLLPLLVRIIVKNIRQRAGD